MHGTAELMIVNYGRPVSGCFLVTRYLKLGNEKKKIVYLE